MSTDFVGVRQSLRWLAPLLIVSWAGCTRFDAEPRESTDNARSAVSSPNTSMLNFARMSHQAVALDADRVLVCGGLVDVESGGRFLDSCEVYSRAQNAWTSTAWPALPSPRYLFTLTRLDAEHVLAVGGMAPDPGPDGIIAIPNAVVGTASGWSAPEAIHARWQHATSLLPDGRVLVVGGSNLEGTVAEVELRSTDTGTPVWTTVGSYAFSEPRATVLQDGAVPSGQTMEVMVSGGIDNLGTAQTNVRLFSLAAGAPASGAVWRDLAALPAGHYRHTATLLDNGDVLVAGGLSNAGPIGNAYRYDRREEKWKPAGTALARYEHSAVRIDRFVVVAGGVVDQVPTDTVEVYDPERDPVLHPGTVAAGTNPWITLAPLAKARLDASMTELADGASALVVGGTDGRVESQTAEIIKLGISASACTDNASCLSGSCVDGVCCNTACNGACQACNEVGHEGTCVAISGTPHAQHPACDAGSVCSAGECTSDCRKGAPCSENQACSSTGECTSDCRKGAPCGENQACSSTGACITLKTPGEACATTAACLSGLACVDGVCCKTSCAGACESCAEPGHEGTCIPIAGEPRTGHPVCANAACAPVCDGTSSACRQPTECQPTGCANDSECAADTYCVAGSCVPKGDPGDPCQADRECAASLSCVDQVCCREKSCGEGGSCALPPYAGSCKKALGVTCSSSFECASDRCLTICCEEGSCPGDCAKASDCEDGWECQSGRCKQKPPAAVAQCSSDGLSVINPDGTKTDCGPYRCSSATSACATSCQASSECVSPNQCDPSHQCREPLPSVPQGCSIRPLAPGPAPRGAAWLVVALAALGRVRRVRRTQRS